MEYAKLLLQAHGIDLGELLPYTEVFENLSNQQEVKKITKKLLSTLNLQGNVSIVRCHQGDRFTVIGHTGDLKTIEEVLKQKEFFSAQRDSKRPYYHDSASVKTDGVFMLFPILSKEEVVGFLCIHERQETIHCWKEIYSLLYIMSFVMKYYALIETTKDIAIIDVVTGLYNSRHFQFQIGLEIEKAKRNRTPLTLVMIEVEDFNEINKKLGFEAGEDVLRQVGTVLKRHSRGSDMPSKLYDDKFAILLYKTTIDHSRGFTDRLDKILEIMPFDVAGQSLDIRLRYAFIEYEPSMSSEEFYELAKIKLKKA